jgi:hypothetical protein
MKTYISGFLSIILVVLFVNQVQAQRRKPNMNFGIQVAQPLGEFSNEYNGLPVGVAGTFSLPFMGLPVEWGIGYAWNNMASNDKDIIALINEDSINGNTYAKGSLALRSNSNRYIAHARVRPLNGSLETFKTTTTITVDNSGYSSELSTNRDHLDMTFFYGWALGLRIKVAPTIYAEARYENITGGMVKYVDNDSVEIANDNTISFGLKESQTNRAVYQLGVAFGF